jgi:hypothetical protein
MHAPEVACSVIAFVISLSSLTCFAIRKEGLVWGCVDGHPNLPRLPVDTIRMTSQLMLTAEAIGIVRAHWALQSQHSAGRRFGVRLEGW